MNLFKKKNYIPIGSSSQYKRPMHPEAQPDADSPMIPDGLWVKCRHCSGTIYKKEMDAYQLCPKCGGHFRIGAKERISITCDEGSFEELDAKMKAKNPMGYPDYEGVLNKAREKSGILDGVITGLCSIGGYRCVIAVMDSNFMMGSMGSVVGEKITRAIEKSTELGLPVIIFTTSGGARMQEGIISLMQMAKTAAAVRKHSDAGLLYVTVITDPTTGGVSASFASLGDIIIAEPKAIIGFAGRRVIEGTINEKLPEDFQSAEFQLEHGFIDKIVDRREMKKTLAAILRLHRTKEADKK